MSCMHTRSSPCCVYNSASWCCEFLSAGTTLSSWCASERFDRLGARDGASGVVAAPVVHNLASNGGAEAFTS